MSRKQFEDIENYNDFLSSNEEWPDLPTKSEILICECHSLSLQDLINYKSDRQNVSLDDMKKDLGLGTGCKSCLKNTSWLKDII